MIELRPLALFDLVARHGGVLDEGIDPTLVVRTIAPSDDDTECDLSPVLHDRGAIALTSCARVLLVASRVADRVPLGRRWVHPRATMVLAELLRHDEPPPFAEQPVHPSARVGNARIEPGARIARDVTIADGSVIGANAVIYPRVRIGARATIGAGAVIGREGFGFVEEALDDHGRPIRIPHRAGVFLEDDVEIGPLATVDAGVLTPTRIGEGSKLDAQVHVGHGGRIGARCRLAAQVGLAGSVVIEDDVWIGGQAGIADHVRIGRGARIAAKAGVIGDVPPGAIYAGYPAVARARWLRGHALLYREHWRRLPR